MAPSAVWTYFSKCSATQVKCNQCSKVMSYHQSTTSLFNHLLSQHKIDVRGKSASSKRARLVNEEVDVDEPGANEEGPRPAEAGQTASTKGPLVDWANKAVSFSSGGKKKAEVDDALIYMITHDNMPLDTPEKEGMRMFCSKLNALYKLPCTKTSTASISGKFKAMQIKLKELIFNSRTIVLTTDLWTETMTVRSFLGLTLHLTRKSEMLSFIIGVRLMEERKTSDNIKEVLADICREWEIDTDSSKITAILTDRGANIKKACRELFGVDKHLACFAHMLNSATCNALGIYGKQSKSPESDNPLPDNDASDDDEPEPAPAADLTDLKAIVLKVKKIVTFFRQSEVASTELRSIQQREWGKRNTECLKLTQEVRTRWNSLYQMLERYLHLNEPVGRVLLKLSREKSSKEKVPIDLTAEEVHCLTEVKELLYPMYRATVELSSEKHITISKCIPLVKMMTNAITPIFATDPVSYNLQSALLNQMQDYFGTMESHMTYAVATMLDPRFKKLHFDSPRAVANTLTRIGILMDRKRAASGATEGQQLGSREGPAVQSAEDDDPLWRHHDALVASQVDSADNDNAGGIPVELRQFLNRPVCPRKANPLEEWESLKLQYPTLYEVALDYLPILATSVPAERMFSRAGIRLNKLRNRMTGAHLEENLVLSSIPASIWFN